MTLSAIFAYYDALREKMELHCDREEYFLANQLMTRYKSDLRECFNRGLNEEWEINLENKINNGLNKLKR